MTKGSRRQWSALVSRWEASGLTCREFSKQVGVNGNTLGWWKWKLRTDAAARGSRSEARGAALAFVELASGVDAGVDPGGSGVGAGTLVLHRGPYRVEVGRAFDENTLARVLTVLEARA